LLLIVADPLAAGEPATVIKLTVEAQPAPKPALRYLLLPELKEMQPGNPVQAYLKCFMEQNHLYHNKETVAEREKWLACPLAELPAGLEDYGGISSRQADYAARLDSPNWQTLDQLRTQGFMLPLPEVQQMRMLVNVLKVRYRAQVKAGKFADAMHTHQTIFALAKHLGEHPTLIGNLVGIAIANLAVGPFEEMIQQPGCPNLYWALVQLPTHLVELRKGFEGERIMLTAEFGALGDPARVWGELEIRKVQETGNRFLAFGEPKPEDREKMIKWLKERVTDGPWLVQTRQGLIQPGIIEEAVKKYPPEQVLFRYLLERHDVLRDEATKWANLPFWQAQDALLRGSTRERDASPGDLIATVDLAAVFKVCRAQARLDQRLALLQTVEALRLHAAENGGKLPASLKEIKLPLPVDPMTGKEITYKLQGPTAHLQGAPPKGEEKNPAYNIRYEVTIKK